MVHIPSNVQHSFYYDIRTHFENAFAIRPDGKVNQLHGMVINKLCNCKQGVEVRPHAVEPEFDNQASAILQTTVQTNS